jgi:hypothetical protein
MMPMPNRRKGRKLEKVKNFCRTATAQKFMPDTREHIGSRLRDSGRLHTRRSRHDSYRARNDECRAEHKAIGSKLEIRGAAAFVPRQRNRVLGIVSFPVVSAVQRISIRPPGEHSGPYFAALMSRNAIARRRWVVSNVWVFASDSTRSPIVLRNTAKVGDDIRFNWTRALAGPADF